MLVVDVVEDDDATAAVPIVGPAPSEDAPAPLTSEHAATGAERRSRTRQWWRVLRWALPVLLIVAVAAGFLTWYARDTYFVGTDRGNVAVFRGRPGGVLFWQPTVEQRTNIPVSHLPQDQRDFVRNHHGQFGSRGGAESFVRELRGLATHHKHPSTTTTLPTTTLPITTPTTTAPITAPPTL